MEKLQDHISFKQCKYQADKTGSKPFFPSAKRSVMSTLALLTNAILSALEKMIDFSKQNKILQYILEIGRTLEPNL